jgi:hypothetical protein
MWVVAPTSGLSLSYKHAGALPTIFYCHHFRMEAFAETGQIQETYFR